MLEGYKGKVYGTNDVGTEHDDSWTMRKIVIENGKVISATGEMYGTPIKDFGESNTDKVIIKTDNKTNIKLEASSGIIPDDTKIDIVEIVSGTAFDKIKNTLVGIKDLKVFDITLKVNDKNIQPTGKVKINIPIPKGFDTSKLVVYRIEENNTKTEYKVKVENGYVIFETDHFSTYVLAEKEKLSNEVQENLNQNVGVITPGNNIENKPIKNETKLPQTGNFFDVKDALILIIIVASIFLIVIIFKDIKYKNINKK